MKSEVQYITNLNKTYKDLDIIIMCMSSYISIKLRLLFPRASYASLVLSPFLRLHVIQAVLYFRENILFFFMPHDTYNFIKPRHSTKYLYIDKLLL